MAFPGTLALGFFISADSAPRLALVQVLVATHSIILAHHGVVESLDLYSVIPSHLLTTEFTSSHAVILSHITNIESDTSHIDVRSHITTHLLDSAHTISVLGHEAINSFASTHQSASLIHSSSDLSQIDHGILLYHQSVLLHNDNYAVTPLHTTIIEDNTQHFFFLAQTGTMIAMSNHAIIEKLIWDTMTVEQWDRITDEQWDKLG